MADVEQYTWIPEFCRILEIDIPKDASHTTFVDSISVDQQRLILRDLLARNIGCASQRQFCKKYGFSSAGTFSQWLNGRRNMHVGYKDACKKFLLSLEGIHINAAQYEKLNQPIQKLDLDGFKRSFREVIGRVQDSPKIVIIDGDNLKSSLQDLMAQPPPGGISVVTICNSITFSSMDLALLIPTWHSVICSHDNAPNAADFAIYCFAGALYQYVSSDTEIFILSYDVDMRSVEHYLVGGAEVTFIQDLANKHIGLWMWESVGQHPTSPFTKLIGDIFEIVNVACKDLESTRQFLETRFKGYNTYNILHILINMGLNIPTIDTGNKFIDWMIYKTGDILEVGKIYTRRFLYENLQYGKYRIKKYGHLTDYFYKPEVKKFIDVDVFTEDGIIHVVRR